MNIHAVAIIQKENKFLLVKQAKGTYHEGLWVFPGGKVETNETLEHATKREINEETNLGISVDELFHATVLKNENVLVLFFKCKILTGVIKLSDDVEEFVWVASEEMKNYKMRPAMYDVIGKLKQTLY